jgi:signal transduction histidine kinase
LVDQKPDLKEVQAALTQCQNDISDQLADFRRAVKNEAHAATADVHKLLDKKANLLDV